MYLSNSCACGGKIEIITDNEDGVTYVSHGVCVNCLKVVVLPQEKISDFLKKDKKS